jgi:hypothetical protein
VRHPTRETSRNTQTDGASQRPRRTQASQMSGRRGRAIGVVVLTAILAAGGLAAVRLLRVGHSTGSAVAAPSGSTTCQHPQYITSGQTAMWNLAPYFVANDMWGVRGYNVSQMLYACSYSDWYVVATIDDSNRDGHVKTYPNSHRDFDSEPEINSFKSITSTFAETSPGIGVYEDAYDIWLNGIGSAESTEVMIWTDNHGQTPSGFVVGTVTIDAKSYTVWKTTGNYIAFVASTNFTSATMNLLDFFKWLM